MGDAAAALAEVGEPAVMYLPLLEVAKERAKAMIEIDASRTFARRGSKTITNSTYNSLGERTSTQTFQVGGTQAAANAAIDFAKGRWEPVIDQIDDAIIRLKAVQGNKPKVGNKPEGNKPEEIESSQG